VAQCDDGLKLVRVIDSLIPMKCPADVLDSLALGFTGFACSGGAPDWLLTGVWLACGMVAYLATSSIEVLEDGLLARPLAIDRPEAVRLGIEEALPDIQSRLLARGSNVVLPERVSLPEPPAQFQQWPSEDYRMTILLRIAESATLTHQIATALLFRSESGRTLLIGTDRMTLAMVLSEEHELVRQYLIGCEEVSPAEYRALLSG
jgi:hypothetical protein